MKLHFMRVSMRDTMRDTMPWNFRDTLPPGEGPPAAFGVKRLSRGGVAA
jgi:hypothetical protein